MLNVSRYYKLHLFSSSCHFSGCRDAGLISFDVHIKFELLRGHRPNFLVSFIIPSKICPEARVVTGASGRCPSFTGSLESFSPLRTSGRLPLTIYLAGISYAAFCCPRRASLRAISGRRNLTRAQVPLHVVLRCFRACLSMKAKRAYAELLPLVKDLPKVVQRSFCR